MRLTVVKGFSLRGFLLSALWDDLFTSVQVTNNTPSVDLSIGAGNVGGNALIADAVRLELLVPEPSTFLLAALGLLCSASLAGGGDGGRDALIQSLNSPRAGRDWQGFCLRSPLFC
jgi:hypothetical protein